MPAVVAMRDPITDKAGKIFGEEFYRSLASNDPIEVATNRARLAIYADRPAGLEWATPVLYMRSASGQLFDLQGGRGLVDRILGR